MNVRIGSAAVADIHRRLYRTITHFVVQALSLAGAAGMVGGCGSSGSAGSASGSAGSASGSAGGVSGVGVPQSGAAFKDLADADLESLCSNVMLPVYAPCEPLGAVECRRALRALRGRPKGCTVGLFEAWMSEASTLACARRWDGTNMGATAATATFTAFAGACSLPPGGVNPPDVAPTGDCVAKCPLPKINFTLDSGQCLWSQPYQTPYSCAVSNVLEFGTPTYDPPTVKNGTTATVTITVPLAKGWLASTPAQFLIDGAAARTTGSLAHINVGNGADPLVIQAPVICNKTGSFGLVLELAYASTIDQCAFACLNDKGAECVP